jgi:hypothetical protein
MIDLLEHNTTDPYGYYDKDGNRYFCYCKKEYKVLLQQIILNIFKINAR